MAVSITFVDGTTVIPANWLNYVNTVVNATISGTVTSVSVATANGFAGTVATSTTTPAITLTTTLTGLLKGNGTAMSAATAGTDYSVGTSGLATGILKSTTTTGALSIATGADLPAMSATVGGAVPTPPNDATKFLSGAGTFLTPPQGTVTSASVVSANGFAGTVATATTTPAITLTTTITGLLKGNATAISAASAGTDYVAPGGALGTPSSGTLSSCTVDGTSAVGFREIPQNSKSAAYTTILSDNGKHIFHPSADTTARTFTIDSNANVAYPIGTALTFINQNAAGVVTIAITTDTMRLAGAGTTGSRTLAANGVATAIKVTSTEWIISGTGLT